MARKPVKKTKVVTYWDCGIEDHTHKSELISVNCIGRQPTKRRLNNTDRDAEVFLCAMKGDKINDIVTKFGLSSTSIIGQSVQRHIKKIHHHFRHGEYIRLFDRNGVDGMRPWFLLTIKDYRKNGQEWIELHNRYEAL